MPSWAFRRHKGDTDEVIEVAIFELPADHPGFADHAYRSRRAAIAEVAARFRPGEAIPDVPYTAEEDEVWRTVSGELSRKHERLACAAYCDGARRLALPADRVPQLQEVSDRLQAVEGVVVRPGGGLGPTQGFYRAVRDTAILCN